MKNNIFKQAIALLSPLKERDFIRGHFTDGTSKCCVIGHFTRLTSKHPEVFDVLNCTDSKKGIRNPMRKLRIAYKKITGENLARINNEAPKGKIKKTVIKALEHASDIFEAQNTLF